MSKLNPLIMLRSGRSYKLDDSQNGEYYFEGSRKYVNFHLGVGLSDSYLKGGIFDLTFTRVEELISPILRKHGILGNSASKLPRTLGFELIDPYLNAQLNGLFPLPIEPNQNLIDSLEVIDLFFESKIFLHIDKWCSYEFLAELYDQVDPSELEVKIGQGAIFKKAVLYYLLKDERLKEYLDWLIQGFVETPPPSDDEIWIQYKNCTLDLKKALTN